MREIVQGNRFFALRLSRLRLSPEAFRPLFRPTLFVLPCFLSLLPHTAPRRRVFIFHELFSVHLKLAPH